MSLQAGMAPVLPWFYPSPTPFMVGLCLVFMVPEVGSEYWVYLLHF